MRFEAIIFLSGSEITCPLLGILTNSFPVGSNSKSRGLPKSEAKVEILKPCGMLKGNPVVLTPGEGVEVGIVGAGKMAGLRPLQ